MSKMKATRVDPLSKLVVVQGGVTYADIADATKPHGLALPWGDAYKTGLGLALGGGIGYLSRAYGLTTDHIANATVVLANGSVVTANSTHNAELLKAMRGAGTVFGVVVELTLRLRDVSGLYGGYLVALDDGRGSSFKAAHRWAVQAMKAEAKVGVEIFEFSDVAGTGQPGVEILVAIPKEAATKDFDALLRPLTGLPNIVRNTLGQLDWWELEGVITDACDVLPYRANYVVSGIATFEQADDEFMDLVFNFTTHLPEGVVAVWLSDYLGNNVVENAVRNTASFTPFGGNVDFHFFIWYSWAPGNRNAKNAAFAEERRQQFAGKVLTTQPYVNLATILTDEYVEAQVGGANNLATLRRLKAELDPTNLFRRHPFVGLHDGNTGSCASGDQM